MILSLPPLLTEVKFLLLNDFLLNNYVGNMGKKCVVSHKFHFPIDLVISTFFHMSRKPSPETEVSIFKPHLSASLFSPLGQNKFQNLF